jgi:hypothetical protein
MTNGPFSGLPKNDVACSIDGKIALSTRIKLTPFGFNHVLKSGL